MAATGNKGKFSDRIKKIAMFKRKRRTFSDDEIQDSSKIYINFLKVMAAIPGFVYGNLRSNSANNNKQNANAAVDKNIGVVNVSETAVNQKNIRLKRENDRNRVRNIDVVSIRSNRKKGINVNNVPSVSVPNNNNLNDTTKGTLQSNVDNTIKPVVDKRIDRVKELEKSIINLIKKDLIKIVNEMEIIQSELYILSEVNGESKELKECQQELNRVKSLLCKIDKLKEKYDFLKDNHDFEYLLEIDNNDLVDKIIELKNCVSNTEIKVVVEDYKLLEVYKSLYLKIDDLQEKTIVFEEKKQQEAEKLKQRDIDFEKLKRKVHNVKYVNDGYNEFVQRQNEIIKDIDEKVHNIDSHEEVEVHIKGFNRLFLNTFKYFGLLMLSPLKGILPAIATESIVTRNLIVNLFKNLEFEENRKMVYTAVDYSSVISDAISDLDNTSRVVDMTLDDIVRLKIKYNEQFKKYQGDFYEYSNVMHKINDMENKILGNKIKIEMMRKRVLEQRMANAKKLVLVKKLNNGENQK